MLYATGFVVGDYVIDELVGTGGSCTVYRAQQRSLNRAVALKIVEFQPEDQHFQRRFVAEVEMMVRLEHIHILPVYGYGMIENEAAYIAMRLLRYGTLADRLRKGCQFSLEQTVRLLNQVASGLDYMHRMGIIHRDLKPSNILLDENENAYLSDFGLARVDGISMNSSDMSMRVSGTPAYIAPELLQGETASVASDVYSLGIILYQMLCGRMPFESNQGGVAALLYQHLRENPPPPRTFNPDLPASVEKVILRALSKKPQERFPSAEALAYYLEKAAFSPVNDTGARISSVLRRILPNSSEASSEA